jgi:hypothetical protein
LVLNAHFIGRCAGEDTRDNDAGSAVADDVHTQTSILFVSTTAKLRRLALAVRIILSLLLPTVLVSARLRPIRPFLLAALTRAGFVPLGLTGSLPILLVPSTCLLFSLPTLLFALLALLVGLLLLLALALLLFALALLLIALLALLIAIAALVAL